MDLSPIQRFERPDATRGRRLRRGLTAAVAVAVVAAAVAALGLLDSDSQGGGASDEAAAATRGGSVYHVVAREQGTSKGDGQKDILFFQETWHTTDGRLHHKSFKAVRGRRGRLVDELAGKRRPGRTSGPALSYKAASNTINRSGFGLSPRPGAPPSIDPFADPGAQLRQLHEQGRLRLAGRTRVDGRPADRLVSEETRTGEQGRERVEFLVEPDTYLPLAERRFVRVNAKLRYRFFARFLTYERLPLNKRNLAQLSLDPHPGATCTSGAGKLRGERSVGYANPCRRSGKEGPARAP